MFVAKSLQLRHIFQMLHVKYWGEIPEWFNRKPGLRTTASDGKIPHGCVFLFPSPSLCERTSPPHPRPLLQFSLNQSESCPVLPALLRSMLGSVFLHCTWGGRSKRPGRGQAAPHPWPHGVAPSAQGSAWNPWWPFPAAGSTVLRCPRVSPF